MITSDTIVIRRAGAADVRVLARLAALDSAAIPAADSLIAERDGVAVAALDLTDGRVVADPFERSVDLVELPPPPGDPRARRPAPPRHPRVHAPPARWPARPRLSTPPTTPGSRAARGVRGCDSLRRCSTC